MTRLLRCCLLLLVPLLAACAAQTSITSPDPGTRLNIRGTELELPARHSLRGTSFGNYEFKAEAPGKPPFYGILPLSFKGEHLAIDVLFFAPAAFFNLRAAFPHYEIDVGAQQIRYRKKPEDPWTSVSPRAAESERARAYFEGGKD